MFLIKGTKILLIVILVFALVLFIEYRNFNKDKTKAINQGLAWIINHKDDFTPVEGVWYFNNLYKITTDQKISDKILTIIKEKETLIPKINTDINIYDQKYLKDQNLRPVIEELLRKKCRGEEYKKNMEKITQILLKSTSSNDIEYLYLLGELGIDKSDNYRRTVSNLITSFKQSFQSNSTSIDDSNLYNLTHIVLIDSDFFNHYLTPENYKDVTNILNKALTRLSSSPESIRKNMDILSEIIFSFKLLQQKPNNETNKVYKELIKLQKSDGSWEQGSFNKRFKIHNTIVATIALTDYPKEFKKGKIYCLPVK